MGIYPLILLRCDSQAVAIGIFLIRPQIQEDLCPYGFSDSNLVVSGCLIFPGDWEGFVTERTDYCQFTSTRIGGLFSCSVQM